MRLYRSRSLSGRFWRKICCRCRDSNPGSSSPSSHFNMQYQFLYSLETECCIKHCVLWDRNWTVLLQRGLYCLTHWRAEERNDFLGLLIEHQYPEVFNVYVFFRFSFVLTLLLLHETSALLCELLQWKAVHFEQSFCQTYVISRLTGVKT
jgi:hypothetical protein